jgi:hypothetical protein
MLQNAIDTAKNAAKAVTDAAGLPDGGRKAARVAAVTAVALFQLVHVALCVVVDVVIRIVLWRAFAESSATPTRTEQFLRYALYAIEWAPLSLFSSWREFLSPSQNGGKLVDVEHGDEFANAFTGNFAKLCSAAASHIDSIGSDIKKASADTATVGDMVDRNRKPIVVVRTINYDGDLSGVEDSIATLSETEKREVKSGSKISFIVIGVGNDDPNQDLGEGVPNYLARCDKRIKDAVDRLLPSGRILVFVGGGRGAMAAAAYARKFNETSIGFDPTGFTAGTARAYEPDKEKPAPRHISLAMRKPNPLNRPMLTPGVTYIKSGGGLLGHMTGGDGGYGSYVAAFGDAK